MSQTLTTSLSSFLASSNKTHLLVPGYDVLSSTHRAIPYRSKANQVVIHIRAHGPNVDDEMKSRIRVERREFSWCLTGLAMGLFNGESIANAAGKRKPPTPLPSEEKKDPNISGVQAKVLASIKRKDAMKAAMAKLRERGKIISPPSSPPPPPTIPTEVPMSVPSQAASPSEAIIE